MRESFSIEVEWGEDGRPATAALHRQDGPPLLYEADHPRDAARQAFDAAAGALPARATERAPRTGEARELRRVLLLTAIAGLSLSALIAIVYFLSADAEIEDDWQIPTTTLAISVYSFLALGAATLIDRHSGSSLGRGGVAVSLLAGALALLLIWSESADDSEFVVKAWAIATVVAVVASHLALLLARARDGDPDSVRVTLRATIGVSSLLAAIICLGILIEPDDDYWWRIVGTLAVLDALGTALVPILRKLAD